MRQRNASGPAHKNPIHTSIAAGALLAFALLLWLLFTPASLGGPFSYVLITGDSMSPAVDDGDIVLLRRAPDYDVGQIVAYRHPELGVVVHRIAEELGASFVVKGDNRNIADRHQPTRDEVIGANVGTIGGAGSVLRALQSPRNAVILIVGAIGLGMVTRTPDDSTRRPRRRRVRRDVEQNEPQRPNEVPRPINSPRTPNTPVAAAPQAAPTPLAGGTPRPTAQAAQPRPAAQAAPVRSAPSRSYSAPTRMPSAAPFERSLQTAQPPRNIPRGPGGIDLGRYSFYGTFGGQLLGILIALMLIATALPMLGQLRGSTVLTTEAIPVGVLGTFRYGPEATGRLFNSNSDGVTQPIFRALTDDLPIVYEYNVVSESAFEAENVTGAYELVAEVRHGNGWRETIVIRPTTLFAGSSVALNGTLDLTQVDSIIDEFELATGITSDIYELGIIATVAIEGELAGEPFNQRIVHPIGFRLTNLQLQFDERVGQLKLTELGSVTRLAATSRTLTIPILGTELAYTDFPRISITILVLCGFGLAILSLFTYQTWRAGEPARIRTRYEHMLVEVESDRIPATNRVLRVARFADLVRIADRENLPILAATAPRANRRTPPVTTSQTPFPDSALRSDPRALIEAFLAGDQEALSIVDGGVDAPGHEPVPQPEELMDLSGQYFVIDGDLTYRYVADDVLPGSRYENYDDRFAEAA
ncbi:MAG: hypothetical protein HOH95_13680 [Dehalococcoidia bacterium]|jgi:signal peptidase I|nr:hypothetical protein [Dehalococcoidia bacterium]